LTKNGIAFVAKSISRYVLTYGGIAFVIAGAGILVFPQLLDYGRTRTPFTFSSTTTATSAKRAWINQETGNSWWRIRTLAK